MVVMKVIKRHKKRQITLTQESATAKPTTFELDKLKEMVHANIVPL